MEKLQIREALPADLPRLRDLWQEQRAIESQLDPRLSLTQLALPDWEHKMSALVDAHRPWGDPAVVFVANRLNQTVGYIRVQLQQTVTASAQIVELIVDAHGGQGGVGSALLDAALDWARTQGVSHVTVPNVPRYNAVQQAFWDAKNAAVLQETRCISLAEDVD